MDFMHHLDLQALHAFYHDPTSRWIRVPADHPYLQQHRRSAHSWGGWLEAFGPILMWVARYEDSCGRTIYIYAYVVCAYRYVLVSSNYEIVFGFVILYFGFRDSKYEAIICR